MKRKSVSDAQAQQAQRLNVRISPEAYERLLIHAIKARVSPGELVTQLIDRHCRDWSMPGKLAARGNHSDRLDPTASVIESVEVAA